MASKKLSKPQVKAMRRLYHALNNILISEFMPYNTGWSLAKLGYVVQLRDGSQAWGFTPDGLQLARALFDSTPDPEPTGKPITEHEAQVAIDSAVLDEIIELFEDSEPPSPVVAETETPAPCIWCGENPALSDSPLCADCYENDRPTSREKHAVGDIVEVMGIQHEVQANGILKQLPPVASKPVSELSTAEKLAMIDSVRTDLEAWKAKQRGNHFLQFADINGHAIKAPSTGQIKAQGSRKLSSTMNMQHGGKKSDTQRIIPPSRQGKPLTPAIPMNEWVKRNRQRLQQINQQIAVLDIVSHIETPLAPQTERRVA